MSHSQCKRAIHVLARCVTTWYFTLEWGESERLLFDPLSNVQSQLLWSNGNIFSFRAVKILVVLKVNRISSLKCVKWQLSLLWSNSFLSLLRHLWNDVIRMCCLSSWKVFVDNWKGNNWLLSLSPVRCSRFEKVARVYRYGSIVF